MVNTDSGRLGAKKTLSLPESVQQRFRQAMKRSTTLRRELFLGARRLGTPFVYPIFAFFLRARRKDLRARRIGMLTLLRSRSAEVPFIQGFWPARAQGSVRRTVLRCRHRSTDVVYPGWYGGIPRVGREAYSPGWWVYPVYASLYASLACRNRYNDDSGRLGAF